MSDELEREAENPQTEGPPVEDVPEREDPNTQTGPDPADDDDDDKADEPVDATAEGR